MRRSYLSVGGCSPRSLYKRDGSGSRGVYTKKRRAERGSAMKLEHINDHDDFGALFGREVSRLDAVFRRSKNRSGGEHKCCANGE